jgi:hypothetical protein
MYFKSLAALVLSVSTAAAIAQSAQTEQTAQPTNEFQTLDRHKTNLVRFDPTVDWKHYTQFQFDTATAADTCLKPQDAAKLNSAIDRSLQSAFKHVGSGSGPVLEIRPVLTGVKSTDTLFNVVSFALIQMPLSYGRAAVKYQLIDAASGRQVGEIASARNAAPWNLPPWEVLQSFRPLGHSTILLKDDSRRLRKDLKRLSRLTPVQPLTVTPAVATEQ